MQICEGLLKKNIILFGFLRLLCHNLFRDGVCEHGQTTGHNTQVPQSPFKVFCFFLYVQLKERIIFKTSSGLLSPVNAVIFPIKISFNLHQLSSILMCKKRKEKEKSEFAGETRCQIEKSLWGPVVGWKHFLPAWGAEREEREREGVGPSARMQPALRTPTNIHVNCSLREINTSCQCHYLGQ